MTLKRRSYHLSYYHILIYIISHLWSGIESKSDPGYSIKVSKHVTVQQGLCVHIPCLFTVPKDDALTKNANGIWCNENGKPVASKRNTVSEKNYRFLLTGNIQSGDCSLYIEDPLPGDKGSYYFRVEDKTKFSYLNIQPYVEVTELTDKPEISPIKSWLVGEKLEMECTFTDNCKRTSQQMKWEGNYQNYQVPSVTHTTSHINGLNIHHSIISFIVSKEQNNSPLSCMLWLTKRVTAINHITLNVEYPPSVDITIDGSSTDKTLSIIVIEGQTKSLECNVDSNPVAEITWFHEDRQLPVINQSLTYILKNISLNHTGRYSCKACNQYGTADKTIYISVHYSPKIVNGRNSSCWKVAGNHLVCTCVIQSVPEPTLKWKINGRSINVSNHMNGKVSIFTERSNSSTNSTLTLPINTEESQNIQCVASNIHGELLLELFNETAQSASKAFPASAIYGGCVIAVLIVIGILLIFFYRKRKITNYTVNSRQTHVSVTDPIYGNSEMFSNIPEDSQRNQEQNYKNVSSSPK
ncbi:sialic acid-binding Ig-like lectin 13 isoform X2 [Aquarana catesbeiana]|uniref:sialic acid-binding Ig-like lectin 13 isoform X2 n=1 Tax=Aquarana catesbeiana TaxID=8400 RepID=UPI003CC9985E